MTQANQGKAPPASILIFDSGVGAISIGREIRQRLPDVVLHFGTDPAFFPYGDKPQGLLTERIVTVASAMVAHVTPDILVIGCNTASTVALDALRAELSCPVVGVVPAIKPAAAASHNKAIALVATQGTVSRDYTKNLIREFAADTTVVNVAAPELVQLAEQKLRGIPVDKSAIAPVIDRIFNNTEGTRIDTVVLACTHFPLLREDLAALAPRPVCWMDSGQAIARRVEWWLTQVVSTNKRNHGLLLSTLDNTQDALALFREFDCREHQLITVA
ncbi:glutamate racemase [Biformimicrobium ophioploci]|uniref:Glutamate racemase n=1 Tax=Biformimicrobium ophioploci TaxID=3036711 RepID=A0ABQ6M1B7_9GAMM|nr:glutamate racemase [Microbulbifer sp. NKW57]GMG88150.1 glutamate racemase [Microbulbifer sp. NKW57]